MLPGTRLLRVARMWFDEHTVAHVFEPLVADWQHEWEEAPTAPSWRRGAVVVAGYAAFLRTLLACGARDLVTVPEAAAARRFSLAFLLAAAAGAAIEIGPFVQFMLSPVPAVPVSAAGLGLLLVRTAPTIVALAMLAAVASLCRGSSPRPGRTAMQSVAVGALGVFIMTGWVSPLANRELMRRSVNAYERGLDEAAAAGHFTLEHTQRLIHPMPRAERIERRLAGALSRPQMLTLPSLFEGSSAAAIGHTVELHRRLQAPVLTITLGLLGWVMASRVTASSARIVMWWMLASLMAYAVGRLPPDLRFSALGVWVPVAVFAAAAVAFAAAGRTIRRSRATPQVG